MQKSTILGILTVIGACFIHLALGYFYTVGNISPYLIKYMGITKSESVWFNSVILACQAVSMPIGGIVASKIGFRPVCIFSMILNSGGVFLSRLTVNYGLGPFIFTYCIMFGFGIGLPYSILFSVASSWFPAHRAAVVGLISSGFGLGAMVFSPIQSALINPNNIANFSDPGVRDNVPNAFLIIGGILLGLQVIGNLIIFKKPAENKEEEDDDDFLSMSSIAPSISGKKRPQSSLNTRIIHDDDNDLTTFNDFDTIVAAPVRNYTVKEALHSVDFYILWTIFFLNIIPITLISSTYKIYGNEIGLDDKYLSAIATTSSAFNCFGRIIWGLIVDRFSFKCPLGWLLLQWVLFLATFPFIEYAGGVKGLYAVWVFVLYFTLAGHFVIMPGACTRLFGPQYMATTYGLLFFATAPSSLSLSAIISQFDIEGKWNIVYLSCAGVCLFGFCLSTLLKDKSGTCVKVTNICSKMCDPCRFEPKEEVKEETEDFTFST